MLLTSILEVRSSSAPPTATPIRAPAGARVEERRARCSLRPCAYYAAQGIDASSAEVRTTIATNTDLVPSRVETIFSYLRDLQGLDSLRGARILDMGVASPLSPSTSRSIPMSPSSPPSTCVPTLSRRGARWRHASGWRTSIPGWLTCARCPISARPSSTSSSSTTRFLPHYEGRHAPRAGRDSPRTAAQRPRHPLSRQPLASARAVHPGPIIHLLPPRVADRVSRLTGWRHSHGRVLLVSVPWLSRELRRAGLVDVRSGGARSPRLLPGGWLSGFYAVTGRKPPV